MPAGNPCPTFCCVMVDSPKPERKWAGAATQSSRSAALCVRVLDPDAHWEKPKA